MDAYRIGVSIALANGVSPVLAMITRDLLGFKGKIDGINAGFSTMNSRLLGLGAVLGGAAILGTMVKLAEKAAEFQDSLIKVSQLNPKVAALVNNGTIQRQAFDVAGSLGMKVEDITKVYGGIYGVLQDPEEASRLTPIAAEYARLQQMRHPGSHPEELINTVMRAGELSGRLTDDKGAIDPEKVKAWFDLVAKLDAATHGQVNPETLMALGQQGGGVALRGLSQEGYEHMAILSQMTGGGRAGTALLALRQQMTGTMFRRNAEAMEHYGMLHPDEWKSDHGRVIMSDAGAKRLVGEVSQDPMKFIHDMVEALAKQGITKQEDVLLAISRILGRSTTQRAVSDMYLANQQIARETKGLEQGTNVHDAVSGYSDKSITANMQNLSAAWNNMLVAVGGPNGENMINILQKLTGVVNTLGSFAAAHPTAIKVVSEGLAALAVGLIGIGAGAVIGALAAVIGIPAAIGGAVLALGTLAILNWGSITAMFSGIGSAIGSFIEMLKKMLDNMLALQPSKHRVFPGGALGTEDKDPDTLKHKTGFNFNPAKDRDKAQPIALSLSLDGRTLAQAISDQLDSLSRYDTSAPAVNGTGRYGA